MAKLSVVVVTRNEEEVIRQCLESVKWADELIVVDQSSTDKTVEIAKQYTDKVFSVPEDVPEPNINKNFGMEKATGDWIMVLDADEIVTPEVRTEIEKILRKDDKSFDGYLVLRKNLFFEKWMKHGGWWGYAANVELARKGKGRYPMGIHNALQVNGNVGYLKNPVIHNTLRNFSQWVRKMNMYTSLEAKEAHEGRARFKFKRSHIIFFPIAVFFRNYFMHRGYKDGFHGLVAAVLASYYEFMRNAKLWEKQVSKRSPP